MKFKNFNVPGTFFYSNKNLKLERLAYSGNIFNAAASNAPC